MKCAAMALALLGAPAAAAAPTLASAEAYVRSIYRAIPTAGFDYRAVRYTAELAGWMRRDSAAAQSEVGVIDAVPFCECQDNDDNYAIVSTRAMPNRPSGARVAVALRNGAVARFTIDLTSVAGQWRVADIHGPHTPSLLGQLRREVPRIEAQNRRH